VLRAHGAGASLLDLCSGSELGRPEGGRVERAGIPAPPQAAPCSFGGDEARAPSLSVRPEQGRPEGGRVERAGIPAPPQAAPCCSGGDEFRAVNRGTTTALGSRFVARSSPPSRAPHPRPPSAADPSHPAAGPLRVPPLDARGADPSERLRGPHAVREIPGFTSPPVDVGPTRRPAPPRAPPPASRGSGPRPSPTRAPSRGPHSGA
jgi:hypothetical protein